jgi:hypothetical protein
MADASATIDRRKFIQMALMSSTALVRRQDLSATRVSQPVRTTLRFAPSAPLRFARSGVRLGAHSWPDVPTRGNHRFQNQRLTA